MLDISYNSLTYSKVVDFNDFYRSKLPEILHVRAIIENSKLLFNLPSTRIILEVDESGERVYKITLLDTSVSRQPFGVLVYLPLQHRLDLYTVSSDMPLIQWKNKKPVFKSYDFLLDRAGLDRLFSKIINAA
jgi:hypothetical protein